MKAEQDEELLKNMQTLNDELNRRQATEVLTKQQNEKQEQEAEDRKKVYGDANDVLKAFSKLGKPFYEGVQNTATKNKSGEVAKRRAKNKQAKRTRKGQR